MTDQEKLDVLEELQGRGIQLTPDERQLYMILSKPLVKTTPDGKPIVQSQVQNQPPSAESEALQPGFQEAFDIAKPGIAPTAGQMLGSFASSMVSKHPLLGMIAQGLGAAGGELFNQATGITPKDPLNVGLTGAIPPAVGGVTKAVKQFPYLIPGGKAALHEEGAQKMGSLPNLLTPNSPSQDLYDAVSKAGNPLIPTTKLQAASQDMRKELSAVTMPSLRGQYGQMDTLLDDLDELIKKYPNGIPFQELRANQKALNEAVRAAAPDAKTAQTEGGGINYGRLMQIKEAFADAMDDGAKAGGAAPKLLKQANQSLRKEIARDKLSFQIQKSGATPIEGADIVQINPNNIAKWVNAPEQKSWRASAGDQTVKEINNWLGELAKIPKMKSGFTAKVGSAERFGLLGLGGLLGHSIAPGPLGATVGAFAMERAGSLVADAMMTPHGRKMMMGMFRASRGTFGENEAMALSTFLNANSGMTSALSGGGEGEE